MCILQGLRNPIIFYSSPAASLSNSSSADCAVPKIRIFAWRETNVLHTWSACAKANFWAAITLNFVRFSKIDSLSAHVCTKFRESHLLRNLRIRPPWLIIEALPGLELFAACLLRSQRTLSSNVSCSFVSKRKDSTSFFSAFTCVPLLLLQTLLYLFRWIYRAKSGHAPL